ncbi:MAG TPA: hypothetical protein ENK50_06690 [Sedimenticola sp.]|nr:hypothetical protein [Sedimenticola sp.]
MNRRPSGRSSHSSRSRHRSKVRTRLIIGLSLALFMAALTLVILSFRLSGCDRELSDLMIVEGREARRLAELESNVEQMEMEIAALVQARLPNLLPLELDKVFSLNKAYAKNIVFSIAGKGGKGEKKRYEYKLVMHNPSLTPVHPHIRILLFDRDGIQIGYSEFGVDKEGVPTFDILEHDETRSQIGEIRLSEEATPRYFTVRLQN